MIVGNSCEAMGVQGTKLNVTSAVTLIDVWRAAESEERDRRYKPGLYADAGIRHLWRIEDEQGLPVVHTYELDDTTRAYVATGVHRDRIQLPVPFPIVLDPAALAR